MSAVFIQRLRSVRSEYDATREAVAYVNRNWQKHNIGVEMMVGVTPQDFMDAAQSLEAIFIIRLVTTFEGILKEHLAKSHPHIAVDDDASVAWLIDRVSTLQTPHIDPSLRTNVHDVRKYRNSLVHSGGAVAARIFFPQALAHLNKYADKLPDPPY